MAERATVRLGLAGQSRYGVVHSGWASHCGASHVGARYGMAVGAVHVLVWRCWVSWGLAVAALCVKPSCEWAVRGELGQSRQGQKRQGMD